MLSSDGPYTYEGRVLRVIDADTLECEVDLGFYVFATHRFRLLGCNAPELRGEDRTYGIRAREFVVEWVAKHRAAERCWITTAKADGFGRWLANVKSDTHPVAAAPPPSIVWDLVRAGLAAPWDGKGKNPTPWRELGYPLPR